MKILVLSDSHSGLSFMRRCVSAVKPDTVIHLGDYFDDGCVIARENPRLIVHQVPGNCDLYRCTGNQPQVLCYEIGGVRLFMTHGHRHNVKMTLTGLVADARSRGAAAALYGHTHVADCHREEDGLWVINPGSCGSSGGSCAVLEVNNEKISACHILRQADLEDLA
ncbi:MAG: YfcE family phosphodiesterase [Oscillospiraceae bacterium]|nr:YfcE family phosphodiesterase [Oscillospiraceae bacterium]